MDYKKFTKNVLVKIGLSALWANLGLWSPCRNEE